MWTLIGGERTFSPEANIGAVHVGDFMRAFGQALPPKPTIPSDDVVRLRLRLIAEEFFELLDASIGGDVAALYGGHHRRDRGNVYVGVCFPEFPGIRRRSSPISTT